MLQRIISIKNVGRFKNCAAAGDVTFRLFTLIFAENARGKTTLCAILRSLFTGDPAFIIGRSTLGSPEAPEVQLLTSNGTLGFRNGSWSASFPDVAIFDGTYVSENVFVGDAVDTEQRRNLYQVIIGAQGVALAAQLNELDNQIRTKNTEIRDNRAELQRYLPRAMGVEAFIALAVDEQIDTKIAAKEQELQAAQRAAELQQRPGLLTVTIPVFPAAFAQLLAKTFAVVSAEAERLVVDHLSRHGMQARGERWLSEGLGYANEQCPFCGQDIGGLDIIEAYKSFFSSEYDALRAEVTSLNDEVGRALSDRVAAAIDQTALQNNGSVEFWQRYCEIGSLTAPDAGAAGDVMARLRQSAQSLLEVKAGTPLDAVAPGEGFTEPLNDFEGLRTALATYNANAAATNAVIEALLKRIIELSTIEGDIVLDSFAGSGTTGAVAHKMKRRWIMVEHGAHCTTHIIPRLTRVIDGTDKSGVTRALSWTGGGGFRFYRVASSLLEKDRFGNWIIAKEYDPTMLAEAMCKLMGFTYSPSQEPAEYWQHGHSTEKDFIYVTTQSLTHDALKKLSEEVGPDRSLMICCKAFSAREAAFTNLTLKKIPQAVLTKCEWGRDDYSLGVANLAPAREEDETVRVETRIRGRKEPAPARAVADLFAAGEGS
jgi:hypothetical protein